MFSVEDNRPKSMYVESSTPQSEQEHIGWYYDSETRKFYRWDNFPWSKK